MPQELKLVGDHWLLVPWTITATSTEDEESPLVRVTLDVIDGKLEVRHLEIAAQDGQREVRQLDLVRIKIGLIRDRFMAEYAHPFEFKDGTYRWTMAPGADAGSARAALRRASKDVDLQEVARVYLAAEGEPRRAVMDTFGVGGRVASRYAQRAREAGLLPPSPHNPKRKKA